MYSIPAATLSSGVRSRSINTEEDDDADEETLTRELRQDECVEEKTYGGGGAVGSLKGLLKMTA